MIHNPTHSNRRSSLFGTRSINCLGLFCAIAGVSLADQKPPAFASPWISSATLKSTKGTVRVLLPSDMAAGDTISGTVVIEPSGKTEKERAKNESELEGCVVELDKEKRKAGSGAFTWKVPAGLALDRFIVRLLDKGGKPLDGGAPSPWGPGWEPFPPGPPDTPSGPKPKPPPGSDPNGPEPYRRKPPFDWQPGPPNSPSGPGWVQNPNGPEPYRLWPPDPDKPKAPEFYRMREPSGGYQFPFYSQAGKPAPILGAFDGDFQNTRLMSGGNSLRTLVESPRMCVYEGPQGTEGPYEVALSEGGHEAKATLSQLTVRLSADKTVLHPGESAQVTAAVSGFSGFPQGAYPVPFELSNESPSVASLGGVPGNHVAHSIQPSDIDAQGRYVYSLALTGVSVGSYTIRCGIFFLWPWEEKPRPHDYLDDFGPTPKTSPFKVCAYLITVGPGKNPEDVPHSAICINGTVYSFEGNGMNAYPNVGAYLNKRKFNDGRDVTVDPIPDPDKEAMLAEIGKIVAEGKKYDFTNNNCAMNAGRIIKAGIKGDKSGLLPESHPLRLRDRNTDSGFLDKGKRVEVKERQVEK